MPTQCNHTPLWLEGFGCRLVAAAISAGLANSHTGTLR